MNNIPPTRKIDFLAGTSPYTPVYPFRPLHPFVFSVLWFAVFPAPCTHGDMRSLSSSRKSSVPCQSKWYRRGRGYKPTLIRLMTGADKMPDGLSGLKHRSLPVHLFFPLFICGMYVHVRGKRLPMRCLVIGQQTFLVHLFSCHSLTRTSVPGHSSTLSRIPEEDARASLWLTALIATILFVRAFFLS